MRNDFFKHILLSGGSRQNRTELETETLPYTFYTQPQTLKNYRIYGNTENDESVGDRTANLFDKENIQRGAILAGNSYAGYSYPESVVHHAYGINFGINRLCFKQLLTVTGINTISISGDYIFMLVEFPNGINSGEKSDWYSQNSPLTIEDKTFALIIKHADERAISDADIENIDLMINSGSTTLPYEPYGYRVPVTVTNGTDTETTNIYLPEQIKMVGDEAEYIDFREQKQYFADGTSADVTLPAIPILFNTNTLSVGTTVQPSKVYLQGKISEAEIVSAEPVQTNVQSLQPLSLDNENAETDVMPSDKNEFQTNDISEMPVEDENSIEEILETENLETTGDEENAE